MKAIMLALTAVIVLAETPLRAETASAAPARLAQLDVGPRTNPPPRGPGVVVEEPRPPGVTIETEGRGGRDCRSVTVNERRDGVKVTRTERRCD